MEKKERDPIKAKIAFYKSNRKKNPKLKDVELRKMWDEKQKQAKSAEAAPVAPAPVVKDTNVASQAIK